MNLSVIIPSYNSADTIDGTLDALENQTANFDYEVIVVDCSDDDSVERVVASRSKAQCLRRSTRFNPGEGRNVGAEAAKGELLVFVDSDVILDSEALSSAWDFYCQGNLLFGGALELNEAYNPSMASYLEHYFFNHESQKHRPPCERANLSSALMIVQRKLFLDAGGFKDIPRMQDTELTERLRRQGVCLKFAPTVVGFQIQDSPMKKVLRKIFINGQNLYSIRYRSDMTIPKKLLFLLLLPLMAGYKVLRIIGRQLRYQDLRKRCITLLLLPLFIVSGIYWMLGFYNGILFDRGISQQR
jgi:glycosyltransferase involved in cell wall biosynthesis